MSDENKTHHMYIDNKNVKRAPKIYINDYTGSGKNGLDLFKNLYDLSLQTAVATTGATAGHAWLNDRVKAGQNLEFFLRSDISHTGTWTPIASGNDPCFNGTFHGEGHTISGLDNSLFGKLCGNVYNLGVTGSFTSAGVADTGDGYVESCWVKSSAETVNNGVMAVFGDPTRSDEDNKMQLVNCYYPESNRYSEASNVHGNATKKPDPAFYNGEVAYDLNNFYLNKRYYDGIGQTEGTPYHYLKPDANGELTNTTGYYPAYTVDVAPYGNIGYVEDRFKDGDFRFAGGVIPNAEDERHWVETVTTEGQTKDEDRYSPIWPDDYIFFGQKLTFGWAATHQEVPTAVVRDGGRLSLDTDANRVYRAPAYYRNNTMSVVHFNPNAYLAAKEKLTDEQIENHVVARDAYPGMTAIDFAGHADATIALGKSGTWFYPPLLDDDGLTGITNCDETRNLLVYAPAETAKNGYANKKTYDVLNGYFTEPAFDTY